MKPGTQVLCIDDGGKSILRKGQTYFVASSRTEYDIDFLMLTEPGLRHTALFRKRFISLPDEIDLRDGK